MASWVGYRECDSNGTARREFVRGISRLGGLSTSLTADESQAHTTKKSAIAAVRETFADYPRARGVRYGAVRVDPPDNQQIGQ